MDTCICTSIYRIDCPNSISETKAELRHGCVEMINPHSDPPESELSCGQDGSHAGLCCAAIKSQRCMTTASPAIYTAQCTKILHVLLLSDCMSANISE
eukprot:scaffold169173_cov39-Prasinocladus_malaysianus.AAC.1